MSPVLARFAPGTGRRQADPVARYAAENKRLRAHADEADRMHYADQLRITGLEAQIADLLATLDRTKADLETAVRSNRSNQNATTVKIDVSALRAAPTADEFTHTPRLAPQYPLTAHRAPRAASSPTHILGAPAMATAS